MYNPNRDIIGQSLFSFTLFRGAFAVARMNSRVLLEQELAVTVHVYPPAFIERNLSIIERVVAGSKLEFE